MKWIVFWMAISFYQTPCENQAKTTDDFGILRDLNSMTLLSCYGKEKRGMSKEFDTLEAAQAFVERGRKECSSKYAFGSRCEDFEIKQLIPVVEK